MARLSLWKNGLKTKDYKFIDRAISEHMGISGTAVYVHRYIGPYDQVAANGAVMSGGITSIQDPLLLENRDRKYDPTVIELRGVYNVSDTDFDMKQFGLFLMNDTIFVELHLNDMIAMCGRRLISGDVIELPHQRDDTIPGEAPALNKFYVVSDASRATDGYSSTWFPHIWRIKCSPMTGGQEYQDILQQQATDMFGLTNLGTLSDLMTTIGIDNGINNSVVDAAKANFLHRNFETQHYWIMPGSELAGEYPWIYSSDGIPPNGEGQPLSTGTSFPESPSVGDYYLRTDYSPPTLFRRVAYGWQIQEVNYRQQEWSAASRLLYDFINNNTTTTFLDGSTAPEKQSLSKAVRPSADF